MLRRSLFGALMGLPFVGAALAKAGLDQKPSPLGSGGLSGSPFISSGQIDGDRIAANSIRASGITVGKLKIAHFTKAVIGFEATMHLTKDRTGLVTWSDALIVQQPYNVSHEAPEIIQVAVPAGSCTITDDALQCLVYDPAVKKIVVIPFMRQHGVEDGVLLATIARNFGVMMTYGGGKTIKV